MPVKRRPRRGSLQFLPHKRAQRIYPRISFWGTSKDVKPLGFAGFKAGMTHIQTIDNNSKSPTKGKIITRPVTVIDAPSLFVCALRFYKKSPSLHVVSETWTDNIPKSLELDRKTRAGKKNPAPEHFDDVRLLVCTQPQKSGMHKKKPDVFELGVGGDHAAAKKQYGESVLGKELSAKDIFKPGEYVDVTAITKGYGYMGSVKRYGIRIQGRKDKQMHRHVGALGSTTPRKVDWRVPQAGQYGFFTRTEVSKRIILLDHDPTHINPGGGFVNYGIVPQSFVLIEGSVPGTTKRLVFMRKASRVSAVEPIDIRYISKTSAQG
ncbi:MAG: 50S ribosomal protein L3 [Candidatus Aenigmarchaeota archaeon]|nr:50S ribosomal protein L3 [Candidatus Aenigmarchaeota archaeon]